MAPHDDALDLERTSREAQAALTAGQYAASAVLFLKVVNQSPRRSSLRTPALLGYALSLLATGDVDGARTAFRNAFYSRDASIDAGLRLAEIYLADNRLAKAKRVYLDVIRASPYEPAAYFGLGACCLRLGYRDAAQQAFDGALQAYPLHDESLIARALLATVPSEQPIVRSRRARVCLLVSPFMGQWLGGQAYLLNFVKTMEALPRSDRPRLMVIVAVPNWSNSPAFSETIAKLAISPSVLGIFDDMRNAIFPSTVIDRYARRNQSSSDWRKLLFASVKWTFPILYPTAALGQLGRPIFWVPDLQHKVLPANFSTDEIRQRNINMMTLARSRSSIVFSSQDAQRHFAQYFPGHTANTYVWRFRSSLERLQSNQVADSFLALDLPPKYYYVPNQCWAHKGYDTVLAAVRLLRERGVTVHVACSGSELSASSSGYQRFIFEQVHVLGLASQVRMLGVLSRDLQFEVLRRACCVIQPSLFEGWSTVVEDTRAIGRPLILSDIPILREQMPSGGAFFKAGDPEALAQIILDRDASYEAGPDWRAEEEAIRTLGILTRASARDFMSILDEMEQKAERSISLPRLHASRTSFLQVFGRLLSKTRS